MSNIKIFKLTSGEEAVADVVGEDNHGFLLQDAVGLVYHQVEDGKMSVGFAPFMPYAEGEIRLSFSAIASSASVKAHLLQEYNRVFSKIIVAPAGSIVT